MGGCASIRLDRARCSADDGGKRAVLRGEHEVSRKAIAQGRPECIRLYLYARVRAFYQRNCTRDRGCSVHPVFPAPSDFGEGRQKFKARAQPAARRRRHVNPSLRAQRSNPPLCLRRYGLLRCARNDADRPRRPGYPAGAFQPTSPTSGTIFPAKAQNYRPEQCPHKKSK